MNTALMFATATPTTPTKDEWATPQDLFDRLHAEFAFQIDLAASHENRKLSTYYSREHSALNRSWTMDPNHVATRGWCNPPYSRGLQRRFIAKAADERHRGFLTVMLLPARTDTVAFHRYIYDATTWRAREGVELRLLPGRVRFVGATDDAPFPSMVVVFRPGGPSAASRSPIPITVAGTRW